MIRGLSVDTQLILLLQSLFSARLNSGTEKQVANLSAGSHSPGNPERMYLFGSRATNAVHPHSYPP